MCTLIVRKKRTMKTRQMTPCEEEEDNENEANDPTLLVPEVTDHVILSLIVPWTLQGDWEGRRPQ